MSLHRVCLISAVLAGPLAACAHTPPPRPVEVQTQLVQVQTRAPCPDPVEYARLKTARPAPLAATPMPASPRERVDKSVAQLGRYEAPGAWADQVAAALDRCQEP